MHVVEFKDQSRQKSGLRMQALYEPNVPYLVPDKLAEALRTFAGVKSVASKWSSNTWCSRDELRGPPERTHVGGGGRTPNNGRGRRLIYSVGGLGDYVATLPALLTAQQRWGGGSIDICTEPIGFELLRCGGFSGENVGYPLILETAVQYDAILFIDDVTDHPRFREWDLIDIFADLLGVEPPWVRPDFRRAVEPRDELRLPRTACARIGVQLHGSSPLRSYPRAFMREILRELIQADFEVHILGEAGACEVPSAPPRFHNWCGRTGRILDLITLVGQMDVLLVPDSFLMHLGGAMDIPTVAMFTTVPSALRIRQYPSVVAIEPSIGCNPCFGRGICPEGHDHCLVWDQAAVSPVELRRQVEGIVRSLKTPIERSLRTCALEITPLASV